MLLGIKNHHTENLLKELFDEVLLYHYYQVESEKAQFLLPLLKSEISPLCHFILKKNKKIVRIELLIGNGSYGNIYLCFYERIERVFELSVIKEINRNKIESKKAKLALEKEEEFLLKGEHPPFIIKMFDAFDNSKNERWQIYKFIPYGSLEQYLFEKCGKKGNSEKNTLDLNICRHFFIKILNALIYLNKCGFVHRDLKPHNIMLNGNEIIVIDLNTIKYLFLSQINYFIQKKKKKKKKEKKMNSPKRLLGLQCTWVIFHRI